MVRRLLLLITLLPVLVCSQEPEPLQAGVQQLFDEQVNRFPQEKVYLHTDRAVYTPGEKIWFKVYLVNANDYRLPPVSRYVYVELISPVDSVVNRTLLSPDEGYYHGVLPLSVDLGEGDYTLRAYTNFMDNQVSESLFRKPVKITSLLSEKIRPKFSFRKEGSKIFLELFYVYTGTGSKFLPDQLRMTDDKGQFREIRMNKDSVAGISFSEKKLDGVRALYFEADKFKHYVPVHIQSDDYDVSFYPEGGNLLHGTTCRVAFKSIGSSGLSENITGYVTNSQGEIVAKDITTLHKGMGFFDLKAYSGEKYFMICRDNAGNEKTFLLPQVSNAIYALKADWRKNKLLILPNQSDISAVSSLVHLLIHQNGKVWYWERCKDKTVISIDKSELPQGILQLILFDSNLNPLSERLVFCNKNEYLNAEWLTDKPSYKNREKVNLQLTIQSNGTPVPGNFSIAITDNKDVKVDESMDIVSTLMLSTELKGNIEDPSFYMQNTVISDRYLDLVMRIHGWRRYDVPGIIKGKLMVPQTLPETSMSISGEVRNYFSNKPVSEGQITFLFKNNRNGIDTDQVITDENGRFNLNQIEFPDSITVYIQSVNRKNRPNTSLKIDPQRFIRLSDADKLPVQRPQTVSVVQEQYLEKAVQRSRYDDDLRMIYLDEVEIVSRKYEKKESPYKSHYSSIFTTSVDMDQIEKSNVTQLTDIFYQIPGVRVVSTQNGEKQLIIRDNAGLDGNTPALILVDGFENVQERTFPAIFPDNVARIEVYKGSDAAIFGSKGSAGVVNIILKDGRDSKARITENSKVYHPLGYQRPVAFYAPKYDTAEKKVSFKPDVRSTIHWQPVVITGKDGKAEIVFYTSDEIPTSYSAVIEGVSSDGELLRSVHQIDISGK